MTELLFPSLTGTKTDCLFGEVAYMFCVRVGSCQTLRLTAFVLVVSGSSALLVFLSYALVWFFTVV